ncbi:MAG: hypothetical protein J6K53_10670 [Roseburia sp.]|nr:hypothetical protein [Roseburia sp.]
MKNEKEYLMLRDEITWRLKLVDSLATFAYTAVVTILGVALSMDVIELFLLPYVVIVPVALKVANHKYAVAYLAGYMNRVLENEKDVECFKWERYHEKYYKLNSRNIREKIIYYGSSVEYIVMSLLSSILFWGKYIKQEEIQFTVAQVYGYIVLQIIVVMFVTYISISYMSFQKTKPRTFNNWERVLRAEVKDDKK